MLKELLCLRLSVLLSIVYIVSCPRKTRFVCARARVLVLVCVWCIWVFIVFFLILNCFTTHTQPRFCCSRWRINYFLLFINNHNWLGLFWSRRKVLKVLAWVVLKFRLSDVKKLRKTSSQVVFDGKHWNNNSKCSLC